MSDHRNLTKAKTLKLLKDLCFQTTDAITLETFKSLTLNELRTIVALAVDVEHDLDNAEALKFSRRRCFTAASLYELIKTRQQEPSTRRPLRPREIDHIKKMYKKYVELKQESGEELSPEEQQIVGAVAKEQQVVGAGPEEPPLGILTRTQVLTYLNTHLGGQNPPRIYDRHHIELGYILRTSPGVGSVREARQQLQNNSLDFPTGVSENGVLVYSTGAGPRQGWWIVHCNPSGRLNQCGHVAPEGRWRETSRPT